MALRYTRVPEQQFVPSYGQINTSLLNQVDSSIESQVQDYRKKMGKFDVARETMADNVSNLSDRDVQYVRERFNRSQQNIRDIAANQGSRAALPMVQRESQKLSQEIEPLVNLASQRAAAAKRLKENEETPAEVRQALLNQEARGVYDEEGNLVDTKGAINERDLEIAANWKDWTGDLQTYINNIREDSREAGQFGVTEDGQMMARKKLEGLSPSKITAGAMAFLQSHPKYREQLELMGRTELKQIQEQYNALNANLPEGEDPVDPPLAQTEDGSVIAQIPRIVRDTNGDPVKNEQGEYKREIIKKEFDSIVQYKAAEIASTYSGQAGQDISYVDTRQIPESMREEQETTLNDRWSWGREEVPFDKPEDAGAYMSNAIEQAQGLNSKYEQTVSETKGAVSQFFPEDQNVSAFFTEDQDLMVSIQGREHSLDNIMENPEKFGINQSNLSNLRSFEITAKSLKTRSDRLNRQVDHAKSAIKNKLKSQYEDDPELQEFIMNNVDISDNGSLNIKNVENQPKAIDKLRGGRITQSPSPFSQFPLDLKDEPGLREFIQGDRQSAIMSLHTSHIDPDSKGKKKPVYVSKNENGELSFYNISRSFGDAFEKTSDDVMNRMVGADHRDAASYILNPESDTDEEIIKTIERYGGVFSGQGEGQFVDSEGEPVEYEASSGYNFSPQDILIGQDGQAMVKGPALDSDEDIDQMVYWKGDMATSAVKRALGPQYERIIAERSLNSILPDVYDKGETKLTEQDLLNLGAKEPNNKGMYEVMPDVTVNTEKYQSRSGDVVTRYYLKTPVSNGKVYASSEEQLINELLIQTDKYFNPEKYRKEGK